MSDRSIRIRWSDSLTSDAHSQTSLKLLASLMQGSNSDEEPLSSITSAADQFEKEYHRTVTFATSKEAEAAYRNVSYIKEYKEHFDTDFTGLTVLASSLECHIDVCAIHSIHTNAIDAFTGESKLWLRDLLPRNGSFSRARVMLYGYDAELSENTQTPRMTSWADAILQTVGAFRKSTGHGELPLIFVGHSMGGLVARRAMELLHQSVNPSEQYPGIQLEQCGILYLSTPHLGIIRHDYGEVFSQLISAQTGIPKKAILAELQSFNSSTIQSSDIWRNMQSVGVVPPFECLCESRTTLIQGQEHEIVGQAAAGFLSQQATQIPNADHNQVCKFDTVYTPGFRLVIRKLITLRSKLPNPQFTRQSWNSENRLPGEPGVTAFRYPLSQDQKSYFGASPKAAIGHFRGRSDVLNSLPTGAQLPQENNDIVALSGMGGIGKSEILLEYGRLARQDNHIFHLQALPGQSFDACVYKLAAAIGSEVLHPHVNLADREMVWQRYGREERVDAFFKWLRLCTTGPCVIIVDDADAFQETTDLESLVDALKSLPYTIVLSTRDPELGNNIADGSYKDSYIYVIEASPEDELIPMMKRFVRAGVQFSPVEMKSIAKIVDGHPMAACLAIQFICQELALDLEYSPVENFISCFRDESDDFDTRSRFLQFKPRVGRSLASCFEISIERLGRMQPLASRVLNFAAYLSLPEVDFRTFFVHPRPWLHRITHSGLLPTKEIFELKPTELNQVLRRLLMTSAITKAGNNSLRIHRLMVEFLLHRQQRPGRIHILRQIMLLAQASIRLDEKREVFEKFVKNCESIALRFQVDVTDIQPDPKVLKQIEGYTTSRTFETLRLRIQNLIERKLRRSILNDETKRQVFLEDIRRVVAEFENLKATEMSLPQDPETPDFISDLRDDMMTLVKDINPQYHHSLQLEIRRRGKMPERRAAINDYNSVPGKGSPSEKSFDPSVMYTAMTETSEFSFETATARVRAAER